MHHGSIQLPGQSKSNLHCTIRLEHQTPPRAWCRCSKGRPDMPSCCVAAAARGARQLSGAQPMYGAGHAVPTTRAPRLHCSGELIGSDAVTMLLWCPIFQARLSLLHNEGPAAVLLPCRDSALFSACANHGCRPMARERAGKTPLVPEMCVTPRYYFARQCRRVMHAHTAGSTQLRVTRYQHSRGSRSRVSWRQGHAFVCTITLPSLPTADSQLLLALRLLMLVSKLPLTRLPCCSFAREQVLAQRVVDNQFLLKVR